MGDDKQAKASTKVGTIQPNGAQVTATCALCDDKHTWTMAVEDGDEVEVNCKKQMRQVYQRF